LKEVEGEAVLKPEEVEGGEGMAVMSEGVGEGAGAEGGASNNGSGNSSNGIVFVGMFAEGQTGT